MRWRDAALPEHRAGFPAGRGRWLAALLLAAAFLLPKDGMAQAPEPPAPAELIVAVKEAPPFAFKDPDGAWRGISIDLWKRIAESHHVRYRLSEQPTVEALIEGTRNRSFDLAVSAITVTAARQKVVEFTQPFYATGLGIAVSTRDENRWLAILRTFLSFGFLQAILVLVAIAMIVGLLVWLFERRHNENFGGRAKGLDSDFWRSAIAMTQAGA